MADVLVTCVHKEDRQNPHEGIISIGGPGGGGWNWPRQTVIESINAGTNTFYTLVNGKRADISVVNGPNGPYIRTHADGIWTDNLLALPECGPT